MRLRAFLRGRHLSKVFFAGSLIFASVALYAFTEHERVEWRDTAEAHAEDLLHLADWLAGQPDAVELGDRKPRELVHRAAAVLGIDPQSIRIVVKGKAAFDDPEYGVAAGPFGDDHLAVAVAVRPDSWLHAHAAGIIALAVMVGFGLIASVVVAYRARVTEELEKAALALETSHQRETSILETAASAVISINASGLIETFNRTAEKMFGYSAEEAIGRNVSMLMPAAAAAAHDGYLRTYAESRNAHVIGSVRELVARRKSGEEFPITLSVSEAIRGELFVGIVNDMTEYESVREQLKQSVDRMQQFADSSADVFWESDAEHRMTWVSSQSVGKPSSKVNPVGRSMVEPWTRESRAMYQRMPKDWLVQQVRTFDSHEPFRDLELFISTRDDEIRWLELSAVPMRDRQGRFVGYRGTASDVTEKHLRRKELDLERERFRDFALVSADMFWESNADDVLIWISAEGPHPGSLDDELVGETVLEPFTLSGDPVLDAEILATHEPIAECIRARQPFKDIERLAVGGGEPRWYKVSGVPFHDQDGNFAGFRGVASDIQELKERQQELVSERDHIAEQEQELRRYRDELEALVRERTVELESAYVEIKQSQELLDDLMRKTSQGFWHLDVAGQTLDVNDAMCRILGRTKDEIIGRRVEDFVDPAHPNVGGPDHEVALWRPDGSHVICVNSLTEMIDGDGSPAGTIGLWTDISGLKQAEKVLRDAVETAESADRAKTEFLAVVSHELRTPLNGILGMVELLRMGDLQGRQRHHANRIRESAEMLVSLVNEILDFTKLDSGHRQSEKLKFSLPDLVEQVVDFLRPRAHHKGLEIRVSGRPDCPELIVADHAAIRQVLLNLLGNAIKFTDEGAVSIETGLWDVDHAVPLLRIAVRDNGIGIPEDVQARIFDKFVQADTSTTRRFGGTGLGLAICRDLVESMGGEIGVSSMPGEGATFWFTAEYELASADDGVAVAEIPPLPDLSASAPSGRSCNVLIAEDNEVNQEIAAELLAEAGHSSVVVRDGEAAVRMVSEGNFDIVLMDLHMPKMDGIEAITRIRQLSGERSRVPIIAVSAMESGVSRDACIRAGANGFLGKPYDVTEFLRAVETHSRRQESPAPAAGEQKPVRSPDIRSERPELWLRLAEVYCRTSPETYEALMDAISRKDAAGIEMNAHKLKSASANVGAEHLSSICREMENLARGNEIVAITGLAPELEREFAEVIGDLGVANAESVSA